MNTYTAVLTNAADDESFVEGIAIDTVAAVGSGNCALVTGVLAGWALIPDERAARDARVAHLVAMRRARRAS